MEYITIPIFMAMCLAQFGLGFGLLSLLMRLTSSSDDALADPSTSRMVPHIWFFGLLAHLSLVLLFKSLGFGWPLAIILPLCLGLFALPKVLVIVQTLVASFRFLRDPFFYPWLIVHVLLGWSLFVLDNGISTPWVNNYGDLTFHLGMIHNFAFQSEFPPEYHVYAGETLSYPFFINLWTVVVWWPFESLASLKVVFALQWLILWACVYAFLTSNKTRFLPWLLLLGGGSLWTMITFPNDFSWKLIGQGYPWTTWLSTIWVTQRSALFGAVACLAASSVVFNIPRWIAGSDKVRYVFAGAILGLSPLVHTHFFIITSLFLGLNTLLPALKEIHVSVSKSTNTWVGCPAVHNLLALVAAASVALAFFPLLLGKKGVASVILGWTVPYAAPSWDSFLQSVWFWCLNVWPWLLSVVCLWWMTKKHQIFIVLSFLFVLGNLIKLAIWEWDQLKVFLAIFTLFLFIWRYGLEQALSLKRKILTWAFAFLLALPGFVELWKVLVQYQQYQVYSEERIELAQKIRDITPRSAIVASPPDHNSAATLSGRRLYFGYPGTLASHQLPYRSREPYQMNLDTMRECRQIEKLCPDFIIWENSASQYWKRSKPGRGFYQLESTVNKQSRIYKIGRSEGL